MNKFPLHLRLVVAAILCALALSACGSDTAPDAATSAPPAETEQVIEAVAETEPVATEPLAESSFEALPAAPADTEASESAAESAEPTAIAESVPTEVDADNTAVAGATVDTDPSAPIGGLSSTERTGDYVLIDDQFGTTVTVTVANGVRTIDANALPNHVTGDFPNSGNPNTISAQDLTYSYTTTPVFTANAVSVRTSGVAVNGVKFEPGTAETVTCSSGENYRVEALQSTYDLGLDFNNAHVQPTGEYHYHGVSELLVDIYDSPDDLVHVGFAADGFLIYYSKTNAYPPSYLLSTTPRAGTDCVESRALGSATLDLEGTTPDGRFGSDWIYTEGAGSLDACNGTIIDGQYVYLMTESYPYISRCLNGEVTGDGPPAGGSAPAGAPAPGAEAAGPPRGAPDFSEAAAALGVTEDELLAALGTPPPDFDAAAQILGIMVEELVAVLPPPPG